MTTLFLGAGPGGTGPLVHAAQNGLLDSWLERGVTIVERRAAPSSALSQYALFADSFGASFLECTEVAHPHAFLVRLRDSPEGRALRPFRDARPPLPLVGAFLARLEAELEAEIVHFPRSRFLRGRDVETIHLVGDRVVVGDGDCEGHAIVIALGGAQTIAECARARLEGVGALGELAGERLVTSDRVVTEEGIAEAMSELARAARPEVVVIGGSHSAFSVAWLLAERAPDGMFAEGALAIAVRRPPRVFYRTPEGAEADGYRAFGKDDICPRTRRVHQLGGLRGDGRELWRRRSGRPETTPEPRVVLLDLARDADAVRARLARATLVVAATGYRPRMPRVVRDGRELPLLATRGGASVDARCRVLTADATPLDRVFSLGMASGFVPGGAMGGEPSFRGQTNGVWLYQHHIGACVHDGVRGRS